MSAQRPPRESEKLLQEIFALFPGLFIAAWYPFPDNAAQLASVMIDKLVLFRKTILEESKLGEELKPK